MTSEYYKIIEKVDNIIKKEGIPYYLKSWKKPQLPEMFNTYDDFIRFLNEYVRSYHFHSFIYSISIYNKYTKQPNSNKIKKINDRPMPTFKYDNKTKIGTIIFYHFDNDYRNPKNTDRDHKKLVNMVKNNYRIWSNKGLNGIIIDLRNHT